jgi:dTDP-4-amino-4,6-dideoxygalactose transaminase
MEQAGVIQSKRRAIWERYEAGLAAWASSHGVQTPFVPEGCEQPFHMYYLVFPSIEERTSMIDYLSERNIFAVFHYLPLNTSDMGMRFGGRAGQCPVAESVSDRLVRLPFYNNLTEGEQHRVIDTIHSWRP